MRSSSGRTGSPRLRPTGVDDESPQTISSWASIRIRASNDPEALDVEPENVKTNNDIALDLTELGQLDAAATHFQKSLAVEPTAEIYSDLGFVLDRQGKSQEAAENHRNALALDPQCASAHFNLAVSTLRRGELDEAAAHYSAALLVKPTAETHNGQGYVLSKQGKLDEAITRFRAAIAANSKYTPAYDNLAGNLIKQGKPDEAASYCRTSRPSSEVLGTSPVAPHEAAELEHCRRSLHRAEPDGRRPHRLRRPCRGCRHVAARGSSLPAARGA